MRIRPLNRYEIAELKKVHEDYEKIQEFCKSRGCTDGHRTMCGYYGGCTAEEEFEKTL